MYAWEEIMLDRVNDARQKELYKLKIYLLLKTVNSVMSFIGPSMMAFFVFLAYINAGGSLTVQRTYTIYAFLNILRLPLSWLPTAWTFGAECLVSKYSVYMYVCIYM